MYKLSEIQASTEKLYNVKEKYTICRHLNSQHLTFPMLQMNQIVFKKTTECEITPELTKIRGLGYCLPKPPYAHFVI